MPRKPRIHQPGACYHVMLRGNAGQNIFFYDKDREKFYALLHEGTLRFKYCVHAFCLMSNHVHILLQVGDISISKIMQNICFRYTGWINKSQRRIGHLFQGRFKAKMVSTNEYFLQLIHYIHLNPVSANLVAHVDEYKWSSHMGYLGRDFLPWLTTDLVWSYFGRDRLNAIENYRAFIDGSYHVSNQIDPCMSHYNTKEFEDRLFLEELPSNQSQIVPSTFDMAAMINFVCKYFNVEENALREATRNQKYAKIRAIIAWLVADLHIETMTSVAKHFNRDVTGLMRTLRRLKETAKTNNELSEIKSQLMKSTSQA